MFLQSLACHNIVEKKEAFEVRDVPPLHCQKRVEYAISAFKCGTLTSPKVTCALHVIVGRFGLQCLLS